MHTYVVLLKTSRCNYSRDIQEAFTACINNKHLVPYLNMANGNTIEFRFPDLDPRNETFLKETFEYELDIEIIHALPYSLHKEYLEKEWAKHPAHLGK